MLKEANPQIADRDTKRLAKLYFTTTPFFYQGRKGKFSRELTLIADFGLLHPSHTTAMFHLDECQLLVRRDHLNSSLRWKPLTLLTWVTELTSIESIMVGESTGDLFGSEMTAEKEWARNHVKPWLTEL
jgi:hypothetical protein